MTIDAEGFSIGDLIAQRREVLPGLPVVGLQPAAAYAALATSKVVARKHGAPPLPVFGAAHGDHSFVLRPALPGRVVRAATFGTRPALPTLTQRRNAASADLFGAQRRRLGVQCGPPGVVPLNTAPDAAEARRKVLQGLPAMPAHTAVRASLPAAGARAERLAALGTQLGKGSYLARLKRRVIGPRWSFCGVQHRSECDSAAAPAAVTRVLTAGPQHHFRPANLARLRDPLHPGQVFALPTAKALRQCVAPLDHHDLAADLTGLRRGVATVHTSVYSIALKQKSNARSL